MGSMIKRIFGVDRGPEKAAPAPKSGGAAHRPTNLRDLVGQDHTRRYLMWKAAAFRKTREPGDHVLLLGPSGCGKTTLSQAYANELGTQMHKVLCPQVRTFEQLSRVFRQASHGDVVFLDEIQELSKPNQQKLYELLEDGRITSFTRGGEMQVHEYERFVVVAATTHEGKLLPALLNRFGYKPRLQSYTLSELEGLVESQAVRMWDWKLPKPVGEGVGALSQGVPRNAMNLLRAMHEMAVARFTELPTDEQTVYALLKHVVIFQNLCPLLGLPMSYRKLMKVLDQADGSAVSLATLASKINEEEATVKDAVEPYLVTNVRFVWHDQEHVGPLIERTSRGRVVTNMGRVYLEACRVLQRHGYMPKEEL
jgi:holliday junction DNA helicase RuvB